MNAHQNSKLSIVSRLLELLGIFLGAVYGLVIRWFMEPMIGDMDDLYDVYNIYSVSFIWIVPIVIGIFPIVIARETILKSRIKQIFYPFLSVLGFFLFALSSGIEDYLCIAILFFPFLFSASCFGLITAYFVRKWQSNKLLTLSLLPLVLAPIEYQFANSTSVYETRSEVIIHQSSEEIWSYLMEVPTIIESEYQSGALQWLGVPRPIRSELVEMDGEIYRMGYFSEGLTLVETVAIEEENKRLRFLIHLNKSKLRDKPTDNHLLKSKQFQFRNITYELEPISEGQVKLILSCEYQIASKMNGYAHFWANYIIGDFESRLLNALTIKIEAAE